VIRFESGLDYEFAGSSRAADDEEMHFDVVALCLWVKLRFLGKQGLREGWRSIDHWLELRKLNY